MTRKMTFVTMPRLKRGVYRVTGELQHHGLWSRKLAEVNVLLIPVAPAYGYFNGIIIIPAVSFSRLRDLFRREYTSLADVLRHEYGHAVEEVMAWRIRTQKFREAFGMVNGCIPKGTYNPEFHITRYAASSASEQFCETFMAYLKHGGRLPKTLATPAIRKQWQFIAQLCRK